MPSVVEITRVEKSMRYYINIRVNGGAETRIVTKLIMFICYQESL